MTAPLEYGGGREFDGVSSARQLLAMRCREELVLNPVFPNAKEMTESFGAADAAIHRTAVDPLSDAVTAVVVGDGSTPRTAATLALRTCWRTISVDPALRAHRVAGWPLPIGRLELQARKVQDLDTMLSGACVVVSVHAHVPLELAIQVVRRCHGNPVAAVAIGCCGFEHRAPGMSLSADLGLGDLVARTPRDGLAESARNTRAEQMTSGPGSGTHFRVDPAREAQLHAGTIAAARSSLGGVPMSQHVDPASITPVDSPLTYGDIMSSPFYADLLTPTIQPGDIAPDFTLERVDQPGVTVNLGDVARNQPVALIFGSYT